MRDPQLRRHFSILSALIASEPNGESVQCRPKVFWITDHMVAEQRLTNADRQWIGMDNHRGLMRADEAVEFDLPTFWSREAPFPIGLDEAPTVRGGAQALCALRVFEYE